MKDCYCNHILQEELSHGLEELGYYEGCLRDTDKYFGFRVHVTILLVAYGEIINLINFIGYTLQLSYNTEILKMMS